MNQININFPMIKIKFNENSYFQFNPISIYNLKTEKRNEVYPVAIYELLYNNVKCQIPYYLSDGKTNGIRGDFLFPFMCYQNPNNIDCPRYDEISKTPSRLIKYQYCKNIDLSKENTKIINSLNKSNAGLNEFYRKNTDVGLGSFLSRLENLLDLIIGIIGNSKLDKYDVNLTEKEFIPYIEDVNDNLEKFIKLYNDNHYKLSDAGYYTYWYDKYWKNKDDSQKKYILRKFKNKLVSFPSEYRQKIIKLMIVLKKELLNLLNTNIIILDNYKNLYDLNTISVNDFNEKIKICLNGSINSNMEINYELYKKISDQFYINVIDLMKTKKNEFLNSLFTFPLCKSNNLNQAITKKWHSNCSNKEYIKSKKINSPITKRKREDEVLPLSKKQKEISENNIEGGYYAKYIKYKYKYLSLKESVNNID